MTYKEKLNILFIDLIEKIEAIDNDDIRDKALGGMLQQVEYQLSVIKELKRRINGSSESSNN